MLLALESHLPISSISIYKTYNLITDLESRQKKMHFQKKWNLIWSLDEPIPSILSGKIRDFGVAEKFKNRDLKPPVPMCRSRNPTPKQKKLLAKRSPYGERYRYLKIVAAVIFSKLPSRLQKNKWL